MNPNFTLRQCSHDPPSLMDLVGVCFTAGLFLSIDVYVVVRFLSFFNCACFFLGVPFSPTLLSSLVLLVHSSPPYGDLPTRNLWTFTTLPHFLMASLFFHETPAKSPLRGFLLLFNNSLEPFSFLFPPIDPPPPPNPPSWDRPPQEPPGRATPVFSTVFT